MNSRKVDFLDLGKVNEPYYDRLVAAAERVIRSGRYVGGEEVASFESQMTRLCGTPCCVGVSNGLDALRLILRALIEQGRLHEGDEVVVPANTYIATVLAVTDCGLVPRLADPDERTMNLTGEAVKRAMTARTRAFITVHLYGRVAWDDEMTWLAGEGGLIAIEDAAQSIGACSAVRGIGESRMAGALGHAAAFSFYPTKNVGALGDAGAVTTHDESLARTVRALANYGSERRYCNIYRGLNCRLDPIQAAMTAVKLAYVDEENQLRRDHARLYDRLISNPVILKPEYPVLEDSHVWHQYVIRSSERDALQHYLADRGIATDINYPVPPHLQPCYKDLAHGDLPFTERLCKELLCLPVARGTSDDDVAYVARTINDFQP